jgi:hypothetical protein
MDFSAHSSWRWPGYDRLLSDCTSKSSIKRAAPQTALGWPQSLPPKPLSSLTAHLLKASFIEWKYSAFLNEAFHGIVGLSLYNPEQRLSGLAEGGLLAVVAGQAGRQEKRPFVWMHLFQLSEVSGLVGSKLKARSGNIELVVDDDDRKNLVHIRLCAPDKVQVDATLQGPMDSTPYHAATETCPLPLSHWCVHNRMPRATSSGALELFSGLSPGHPHIKAQWHERPSYFEHAWGLHPLPFQGWDFMFAPGANDAPQQPWAVLQSYHHMPGIKRLDLGWTDPQTGSHLETAFTREQLTILWQDPIYVPDIGAWLPKQRLIRAQNSSFSVELRNTIPENLHFIRKNKAAVRCFFIAEQLGQASWTLKDKDNQPILEARDILAGGEVAHARLQVLGRWTRPFPV